jgi:uncharacterized membrane protein
MTEGASPAPDRKAEGGTANVVYILYLASLVTGVTGLIGVVVAYIYRGDAPPWVRTHYEFQIRTFWIALLMGVVGSLLSLILIGFLILAFEVVWIIVRCVKGLQYVSRGEAHPDPEDWLFG